jgi:DNA-binding NarL/FixJ family response regulator
MQVFLVEDSPLIRERLVALLGSVPGAQVCGHADRAESAVREILARRPDVVVLDIALAEGTGFDVLRAVHPQAPQIDFYLLSNFCADAYRALAARLGARGFFDKSSEFERVREIVKREKGETPCRP